MSLANKTKTALDEARMLMLGAQILLGFQFQAPFQNAFSKLSQSEKLVEMAVLGLIILVVALLVAPSAHHRIVEDGEATLGINQLITRISTATLLSFAVALGLDLGLAASRIAGEAVGVVTGLTSCLIAAGLWFGPLAIAKRMEDDAMPTSNEKTPVSAKIDFVLTEARVVLPGAQALLGFQLAIVLTESFAEMPFALKLVHGLALALIAISTMLLVAPAAYHRIVYAGSDAPEFHRVASRLLLFATIFLALGLAADTHVVVSKITGSSRVGTASAVFTGLLLLALWYAWPWWRYASDTAHRKQASL
jgi:hypothetical protein